jgi:hypothetical protein
LTKNKLFDLKAPPQRNEVKVRRTMRQSTSELIEQLKKTEREEVPFTASFTADSTSNVVVFAACDQRSD